MNTNCPNCDDPACDAKEAFEAWAQEPANGNALQRRFDSNRRCLANRVNWRARALTEAARADAAEARIAAVAKFEWAEWMIPMLDGLAMVLVQAERTGRPVATRLMCRVEGPGGDDDDSGDVPMVSVWATTGDGNPIDRCAELSAKVLALGGEP